MTARLHLLQLLCADHVFGLCGLRDMQGDDIRLSQQGRLIHLGCITQGELVLNIAEDHSHAHGFCQDADLGTNMAIANDPQSLTSDFIGVLSAFQPAALVTACIL